MALLSVCYSFKTYNTAAPNGTDQQQFATVTPEGVISSKLPDGVTNNMACVGKEPIVRIMLCDTVTIIFLTSAI